MTPPTGKSCFVFLFALRACVREALRDQGVSRHVFVIPASRSAPGGPDEKTSRILTKVTFSVFSLVATNFPPGKTKGFFFHFFVFMYCFMQWDGYFLSFEPNRIESVELSQ